MLTVIGSAVCFAALIMLPGLGLARLTGWRGASALSMAVPLGLGAVSLAQLGCIVTGMHWYRPLGQLPALSWLSGVPVLGEVPAGYWLIFLATAAAAIVSRGTSLFAPRRACVGKIRTRLANASVANASVLSALVAVALVATTTLVLFAFGLPDWGAPAQAFDSVFHQSAVMAIRTAGNPSPFGGLNSLYFTDKSAYYPTLWHSLVALIPGNGSVASLAAVYACLGLLWPCTLLGLVRGAFARPRPWASAALVVVGCLATGLGWTAMTSLAVWPYGLSLLALPGALLALAALGQRLQLPGLLAGTIKGPNTWWPLVFSCLLGTFGALMAHGTAAFNMAVLMVPTLALWIWLALRALPRKVVFSLLGLAAVLVAGGAWVMRSTLSAMAAFDRPGGIGLVGLLQSLTDLGMYGPTANANALAAPLVVSVVLFAAWQAYKQRRKLLLATWGLVLVLIALTDGPNWVGRLVAAPWYTQKSRLQPLAILMCLLLIAGAIEWLLARGKKVFLRRPLAATLALVLLGAGGVVGMTNGHIRQVQGVYLSGHIDYGTILSDDARILLQRSATHMGPGDKLIGAPSRGETYAWPLANVRVMYATRAEPSQTSAEAKILKAYLYFGPDSRSCQLLRSYGVTHYLTEDAHSNLWPYRSGPLADGRAPLRWDNSLVRWPTDTMELVDQQGGAYLYKLRC